MIEPHYPKAGNGRRPVWLAIMLRTYFMQQWFNLSDPGVEEAFYESATLRRFAGVDLGVAPAPEETTVLRFRHLLEKHDRLREPLPFGFATDPAASEIIAARVAEFIGDLPRSLNAGAALDEVTAHFHRISQPSLEGNLLRPSKAEAAADITPDSHLRVRTGTQCLVNSEVEPAQMLFGTNAFQIASRYEDACRFITKMRSSKVSELPGDLELSEKLVLAKRLISERLLTAKVPLVADMTEMQRG